MNHPLFRCLLNYAGDGDVQKQYKANMVDQELEETKMVDGGCNFKSKAPITLLNRVVKIRMDF